MLSISALFCEVLCLTFQENSETTTTCVGRSLTFFFRDISIFCEVSMSLLTYGRLFHRVSDHNSMKCEERDSNSQTKWQQNLNLPRLPLPPSSQQVISHDITCSLFFSFKETQCTTDFTKLNLNTPTNWRRTLAMREEGIEPSSLYRQRILSPLCLPISSFSQIHSIEGTTLTYCQVLSYY